jgi:hypothetical protein
LILKEISVNYAIYFQSYIILKQTLGATLAPSKNHQIMRKRYSNTRSESNKVDINILGYPTYPEQEDIYKKYKEEKDIKPENTKEFKDPIDMSGTNNEKSFKDDYSGSDLDIPGSELDDAREKMGNEDEENNFYSLGGDDHSDLDESQGDSTIGFYKFYGF